MRIVIEGEAAAIVERLVAAGGFASAQEAVEDALRVAEAQADGYGPRDAERVAWMRARVQEADAEGGEFTMDQVEQDLEAVYRRLERDPG